MTEERTLYGTKAERLAQLLGLAAEAEPMGELPSARQQKADLLHDLLATKLPWEGFPEDRSSSPGVGFSHTLHTVMSESIGHQLLQEQTTLDTLEKIKAYAARYSRAAGSSTEQEPANVLYYAAIAGALIGYQRRITEFSLPELEVSFARLSPLPWVTVSLRQLFEKAIQQCQMLRSQTGDADAP